MALVANSVNASSITPDAVSEIQSGLATAAALAIVNDLLDPEIAQILARVNSIPTNPATAADIPTPQEIATAHLDLPDGIETGWTVREATRVILGEAGGLLNGAQTPTNIFTNPAGTKNRITATVDEDGNRTAIVYDKT
jgi:spermidine/putrescine-binding protein